MFPFLNRRSGIKAPIESRVLNTIQHLYFGVMLFPGRIPYLSRCVGIDCGDGETHDQIRPRQRAELQALCSRQCRALRRFVAGLTRA